MKKQNVVRNLQLGISFLCGINVMAQNDDGREFEFGIELTSELQTVNNGRPHPSRQWSLHSPHVPPFPGGQKPLKGGSRTDLNNANLLRLNALLPVSRNVSIEAASISTYMTAAESIGDDLQTFSNLDAGNIPFALSVCNVAWQIDDRHSLFMGIRNMNEDYFCSDVTSFFTNSSCGIYPTISANYPIANYPVASVGIHYCYDANPVKVQASLYNGTGYNRFTGRDNVFRVCPKSDGVFGITEMSYNHEGSSYFLGNALYYKEGGMSATPWFYAEQSITSRLTLLAGYSHAFAADAECKDFAGCGILCQFGKYQFGVFSDYADFAESKEFATELTCRLPILQHLDVQPTVHLITHDGSLQSAATVRMTLSI